MTNEVSWKRSGSVYWLRELPVQKEKKLTVTQAVGLRGLSVLHRRRLTACVTNNGCLSERANIMPVDFKSQ